MSPQIQYLKFLTENPTKDGGFFEHCDNIAILSDSETRNNRLFTIPISPPPQPINSTDYCDSLSGAPPETFVTKVDAVTVTGRDAIMFTNCTVLKTSHGCYTPLFAVFNPKEARSPVTVSKIPVAASVLQFAGNEYFHWITEGLARLLILQVSHNHRWSPPLAQNLEGDVSRGAARLPVLLKASRKVLETSSGERREA